MTTAGMKTCAKCRQQRPVTRFSPNPKMRDGLSSWCRPCATEATRRWRAANPAHGMHYAIARRVDLPKIECVGCRLVFRPSRKDQRYCCSRCNDFARQFGGVLDPGRQVDHIVKYHREELPAGWTPPPEPEGDPRP